MEADTPERPVALAATDRPLPLRLESIEDERAPDGMSCIGSFLGPKLVARCVVPPDAAAFLLERGLFSQPVRLALAAREEPPGLQCQLFALVELPDDFFAGGEEGEEQSPWAESVPGAAYDREISGEPPPAEPSAESEESDGEDEQQAAVFLGQIIRFEKDRRHPGDLALETMDVLRTIVQGDVSEVVDKVLEDLLGGAGPPVSLPIEARGYARPEVLVSTAWVAERLGDPAVRLLESDEDVLLYDTGHLPGALKLDWVDDLNDPVQRDYIGREEMERLLRAKGISADTTIVLYGDRNNWWATYAFWVLRLFGLERLKLMDGGRQRWIDEGRPLETGRPAVAPGHLAVPERREGGLRAFRDDVLAHVRAGRRLVDVRSPEEFRGERLHLPDYPNEGALRGGHIPGARNIPWGRAVDPETHCFKSADELRAIYEREQGLAPGEDVVVYCRIGERSSHTWFVLTYLLGYPAVLNYDGSWTEWGNAVRAPIERP